MSAILLWAALALAPLSGGANTPCPECDCEPGTAHASWCRFEESDETED